MFREGYSEFAIKKSSIRFHGDTAPAKIVGCVGSCEETMNVKNIQKKCEGVVVKNVIRGDGTGELKLSLHMKYALFTEAYGMEFEGLKDGVHAYGRNSVHKPFCFTCETLDEEDDPKLKAYPNCVITSGIARKIENGGEEVAEIELTIGVAPDEEGQGLYEAIVSDIKDEELKTKWLTEFDSELAKAVTA